MCLSISVEDEYSWLWWNSIVTPNPPLKFLAEMLPEIDCKEHEHIFPWESTLHHGIRCLARSIQQLRFTAQLGFFFWSSEFRNFNKRYEQNIELQQLQVNLTSNFSPKRSVFVEGAHWRGDRQCLFEEFHSLSFKAAKWYPSKVRHCYCSGSPVV